MAQTKVNEHFYVVYDNIAGDIILSVTAISDSIAVRKALSSLRVPLKDTELYHIADVVKDFDNNSKTVKFGYDVKYTTVPIRYVDWSVYSFPETPAEALAPLGPNAKIMEE